MSVKPDRTDAGGGGVFFMAVPNATDGLPSVIVIPLAYPAKVANMDGSPTTGHGGLKSGDTMGCTRAVEVAREDTISASSSQPPSCTVLSGVSVHPAPPDSASEGGGGRNAGW